MANLNVCKSVSHMECMNKHAMTRNDDGATPYSPTPQGIHLLSRHIRKLRTCQAQHVGHNTDSFTENTRSCFQRRPRRLDRLRVWPAQVPHCKAVVVWAGALKCGKNHSGPRPPLRRTSVVDPVVTRNGAFLNKHCMTIR